MNYRRVASFTGWLWIITFVTSIPARFWFYAPVLDHEGNYVTGAGTDAQTLIAIGAVLELLLIISNVGTAVVPYSIHKRVHEAGAVAYVTARLVECTFIAIGIVCMLAISSLRQDAPSGTDAAVGQGIFAVYEWTFRIGPGVFAGIGNGLILGWLMYRSGLVPPRFALFGLVGGPLVSIVGVLVIVDAIPAEGPLQVLVAPEFIWELGIGIYLIVKGYRTSSPALAGTQDAPLHSSSSRAATVEAAGPEPASLHPDGCRARPSTDGQGPHPQVGEALATRTNIDRVEPSAVVINLQHYRGAFLVQ